jgi:hypothetical protein
MQLIYQYQGSDNVLSIYADATESFLLNAGNQAVYLWNILGAEVNTTTASSTSFSPCGVAALTSLRYYSSVFTQGPAASSVSRTGSYNTFSPTSSPVPGVTMVIVTFF